MAMETILLADDVELFLELEKTFFRREGFNLLVARTGKEALELVVDQRPDLVLMDLYMPQMNGDEACRWIKDDPELARIPVIMVTQAGRPDDLERCRAAGCDDILLKPINRHKFITTAHKYLQITDRTAPRVPARLRVHYGPDPQQLLDQYSVNLSTGGMFLECQDPLPVDTPLTLELCLHSESIRIQCKARVAWVNHPEMIKKPHLPPGMGLQFVNLSLENMHVLREFIKQQCLKPDW